MLSSSIRILFNKKLFIVNRKRDGKGDSKEYKVFQKEEMKQFRKENFTFITISKHAN